MTDYFKDIPKPPRPGEPDKEPNGEAAADRPGTANGAEPEPPPGLTEEDWASQEAGGARAPVRPGNGQDSGLPAFAASPLDWDAMLAVPPRQWVYGHFLIRRFVSVLGAPGGAGKTAYAFVVGAAIATGTEFLREPVHETGSVWIYNLEDPKEELLRRFRAAVLHHGIAREEIEGRVFIDSGRDRPLIIADRRVDGTVVALPVVEQLIAELNRRQIRVLIVDPFVRSHRLVENDNDHIDFACSLWAEVANQADCSVLLVHHFRKAGAVPGDVAAFRGASSLIDAARAAIALSTMSEAEAGRFEVPEAERWRFVRVDNAKLNLAPPPDRALWMKLVGEDLENAADGRPSDHVQSVERWEPPTAWEGLPMSTVIRILDLIDAGPGNGEFYAAAPQAKDRWAGRVIQAEGLRNADQAKTILREWLANGVLEDGQYSSPKQKAVIGCVRAVQAKVAEMRRSLSSIYTPDEP